MIMSYKKRKLNNRGFSLVEVLVAIVILAIISLPVLSTFSNAARINARARRTENANTAINNIIEEAKTMPLENLVNRQGQYYYAPTTDNNTYVVSDERGVSYYTGVNGEKYYIKATFDPGPYTDSDSTTDNKKNNITYNKTFYSAPILQRFFFLLIKLLLHIRQSISNSLFSLECACLYWRQLRSLSIFFVDNDIPQSAQIFKSNHR